MTEARRKSLTLLAAILGTTVTAVDATVTNVALPQIQRELGGGLAGQQWVANAYLLTLGSLILIGGALADRLGERRVFALGVTGFGITSVACALAPSIEILVVARALQGVSGALLTPSTLGVIAATFSGEERGAAVGTWTAWSAVGMVIGPLVGGQIVDSVSWRWIFAINVPFVLGTLALIRIAVAGRGAGRQTRRLDLVGAALCALGLAGVTFALIEQSVLGFESPAIFASLIGGVVVFVGFLLWERRHKDPMLPLELFRRRNFAAANAQTLAMYAGLGLLIFFLVLFLQQVAGYSALQAGLTTLPTTVVMFALSRRFGRLADRRGPRLFLTVGPLVASVGLALLSRLDADVSYVSDVLPGILVFAFGLSMTVAPLTATVLSDADEHNAGIASAVNNAVARVAGLLGTVAVGAVIASGFGSALDDRLTGERLSAPARAAVQSAKTRPLGRVDTAGLSPGQRRAVVAANEAASVRAFRLALRVGAALLALAGLLGAVGIRNRRRPVAAEECPGGAVVGAHREALDGRARTGARRAREPAPVGAAS